MSLVALILVLLAAIAALRALADRSGVPLPTLPVLGGFALALIPGLPQLTLNPETIFLIFIPPLLFWTAIQTSLRDLRRNLRICAPAPADAGGGARGGHQHARPQ